MLAIRNWIGRAGATAATAALLFHISPVLAVPFSSDLSISGDTYFDDGTAAGFSFGASGDFSVVEGGATTTSTYNDFTVTGANPLPGTLTDIDDGFGFSGSASVTNAEFAVGLDTVINVTNNSLTDIYQVVFRLTYSNSVNADGDNAFADSELTLDKDGTEIFFSDLVSDTMFGDTIGGVPTGGSGDPLAEIGDFLFSHVLNPSEFIDLDLIWTLEGGDFDSGLAEANLTAFLSVDSVVVKTPIPGTVLLLALGIVLLPLRRYLRR